jgi:hypothetical protein
MVRKEEIERWLATLPAETPVGVDDGGLALRVCGDEPYLEVGGIDAGIDYDDDIFASGEPNDDEEDDDDTD